MKTMHVFEPSPYDSIASAMHRVIVPHGAVFAWMVEPGEQPNIVKVFVLLSFHPILDEVEPRYPGLKITAVAEIEVGSPTDVVVEAIQADVYRTYGRFLHGVVLKDAD